MAVTLPYSNSFSKSRSDNVSSSSSFQDASSNQSSSSGAAYSPEQLARIQQLFPQLLAEYGSYNTATPFSSLLAQIGGTPTDFPGITTGPIWGEPQIQGRVNAFRAQNDAATAGKGRRLADTTAGRGFGTNSPLYQELMGNLSAQNLSANTLGENDLRWNAAQGNAQHLLSTEQANVGRSAAVSADDLARRQMALSGRGQDLQFAANRQNALLQALNQYNQPLPFSKSSATSKSKGGSVSYSSGQSKSSSGSSSGTDYFL